MSKHEVTQMDPTAINDYNEFFEKYYKMSDPDFTASTIKTLYHYTSIDALKNILQTEIALKLSINIDRQY
jgi:hypothetical protein